MKLRNLANRLLLILFLVIVCCGQTVAPVIPTMALLPKDDATAKVYYFDQYNYNEPTDQSLYDALGIKVYNDYLSALAATQDLEEVVIAVVDSGIDMTHPVFEGRILTEYAANFSQGVKDATIEKWDEDHNGHGTHVAGVIADATLDNVKILPIKIFSGFDNDIDGYAFDNAIRYLCALKSGEPSKLIDSKGFPTIDCNSKSKQLPIVAVNLSLGTDGYNINDEEDMIDFEKNKNAEGGFQSVINSLLNNKILPIVAAGNVGSNENSSNIYYSLPAACDGVLSVTGYNNTSDTYRLGDFSYHNDYVGISAPGMNIWSACSQDFLAELENRCTQKTDYKDYTVYYVSRAPYYVYQDENNVCYYRSKGTSMATPFVTACYAMLYSDVSKTKATDYGFASWDDTVDAKNYLNIVHKALLAAAMTYGDKGEEDYDIYFGYGVVTVANFASAEVDQFDEIENVLPEIPENTEEPEDQKKPGGMFNDEEIDWVMIGCIVGVGSFLVWMINRIKSYFTGGKTE